MSSGIVRSEISSILDDSTFSINSRNASATKQLAERLLEEITRNEETMDVFDAFSASLLSVVKTASNPLEEHRTCTTSRERAWASFHSLRVRELPELWRGFFSEMKIYDKNYTGMFS